MGQFDTSERIAQQFSWPNNVDGYEGGQPEQLFSQPNSDTVNTLIQSYLDQVDFTTYVTPIVARQIVNPPSQTMSQLDVTGNITMQGQRQVYYNGMGSPGGILGTDVRFDTITGAGGAGSGNIAPGTITGYNLADYAIPFSKLTGTAQAQVVAFSTQDTSFSMLRSVSATGTSLDSNGKETDGLTLSNSATRVADSQAYRGFAITNTGMTSTGVVAISGPGYAGLAAGMYVATVFVRATTTVNTSTALTLQVTGTAITSSTVTLAASDLATTYVGIAVPFTVTAATNTFNIQITNNLLPATVNWLFSHVRVQQNDGKTTAGAVTFFFANASITSAQIQNITASQITAGIINSDDIFIGTGGHLYAGNKAGGRVEFNSAGISAFQTVNLLSAGAQSFESGVVGWNGTAAGYTTSTLTVSTAQKYIGTQSLLITWPTTTAAHTTGETNLTGLTIGTTYSLSAYVYVPSGGGSAPVAATWSGTGTNASNATVAFVPSSGGISVVQSTGSSASSTSVGSGTLGAAPTSGNLLLIVTNTSLFNNAGKGANTPAGYTLVSDSGAVNTDHVQIFAKTAGGSEPTSVTVTFTTLGTPDVNSVEYIEVSGCSSTVRAQAAGAMTSGAGASITANNGDYVIAAAAANSGGSYTAASPFSLLRRVANSFHELTTVSQVASVGGGSPAVRMCDLFGSSTPVSGNIATTTNDTWVRIWYTFIATATTHFVGVVPNTAPTAGQTCYLDAAQFEVGNYTTYTSNTSAAATSFTLANNGIMTLTNASGASIAIDPNVGLNFYNTSGVSSLFLDITTGNATFSGNVVGASITGSTVTVGTNMATSIIRNDGNVWFGAVKPKGIGQQPTVGSPASTTTTTGGSVPAGSYNYVVVCLNSSGVFGQPTFWSSVTTSTGTSTVTLNWTNTIQADPNSEYETPTAIRVYRQAAGFGNPYYLVSGALAITATTFTDTTGLTGISGSNVTGSALKNKSLPPLYVDGTLTRTLTLAGTTINGTLDVNDVASLTTVNVSGLFTANFGITVTGPSSVTGNLNVSTLNGKNFGPGGISAQSAVTTDASGNWTVTHNVGSASHSFATMSNFGAAAGYLISARAATTTSGNMRRIDTGALVASTASTFFYIVVPY